MNFSQRQADPRRHLLGLTLVILFHAFVVYALVTGLAKKVVEVVRAPIETKVIEEIKKPPPPPEIVLPPPPKMEAPPPPFIPPPEVQIATPPPPAPTISVAPSPTPPAPVNITPTPPVVAAAPAPARPSVMAIGVACAVQVQPIMPQRAVRDGIGGSVRARATIKGGKVIAVEIVSSQPRGMFDNAVRTAMMQYGCSAAGDEEIKAEQSFDSKLE
jgi:periplasmic protein TonB